MSPDTLYYLLSLACGVIILSWLLLFVMLPE